MPVITSLLFKLLLLSIPVLDLPEMRTHYLPGEVPLHMVRLPAGAVTLAGRSWPLPSFWVATTEVTEAQWASLMPHSPAARVDLPVRRISWQDVQRFCAELNRALPNGHYRLPYEAEWVYAASAGHDGAYAKRLAAAPSSFAWFRTNSGGRVQPVAGKLPNPWGLYDTLGNVWEWCQDAKSPIPLPPSAAARYLENHPQTERVRKGGSALYGASANTWTYRYQQPRNQGNGNIGFRLVWLESEPPSKP